MHRFFVSEDLLGATSVSLGADVAHHCKTVLRLAPGTEILLLDGKGTLCRCTLSQLDKRSGEAQVLERWHEDETAFPLQLLQALPKGDKMDLVLQKGTELGIRHFSPLCSERSVPSLRPEREAKRCMRWLRIVSEAARQSRRPCLPTLDPPRSLAEGLGDCQADLRLMLWEEGSIPLAAALPPQPPATAALLVGPEGGFTAGEAEQARAAGFIPVHLGPRILRSETAGFAVAGILQFLYGDMGPAPTPAR